MPGDALVFVPGRGAEDIIAVHEARPHAVDDLFGVLLALMLRDGGQQVLDKHAVGVLAELNGGALQLASSLADGSAQFDMSLETARQTADVVDDDNMRAAALLTAEEAQHGQHAGPVDHAAGDAFIPEHLRNLIATVARKFAAARLLRDQSVAFLKLPKAGDAAVNNRTFRIGWNAHYRTSFLFFFVFRPL
nr:hypothetical protein [Methyloligella halotolerans]